MPKSEGSWTGFQQLGQDSLIDRMTREAQAARDAHEYLTVKLDGRVYPIREPWEDVMARAAAKFGTEAKR